MLSQIFGRLGTQRIALPYMRPVNHTVTLVDSKTVSHVAAPWGKEHTYLGAAHQQKVRRYTRSAWFDWAL